MLYQLSYARKIRLMLYDRVKPRPSSYARKKKREKEPPSDALGATRAF
jgi:hypothetical protein